MWTWLTRSDFASSAARKPNAAPVCRRPAPARAPKLNLEALEAREVPAIAIQFDYSYDAAGFSADPNRRAVLQRAADDIAAHLDANLPAILPGGANGFSMSFFNPADGQVVQAGSRAIPANTLLVYAGGRPMGGGEAGF